MPDPDFAVLCAIRDAPLDGPAVWARRTGIDSSGLRRRIKRLEESGALRGFTAIPAAACFGRRYRNHQFYAPNGCDMDALLAVPDVAWAARTADGNLFVISYEADTDRRPELEAMLGTNIGAFVHSDAPKPAVLGRIELKVLRELIIAPRASVQQLVERTGLSSKTVRAYRAKLVADGLVTIDPVLRTPHAPGRLYYNLAVEVDDKAHRKSVAGVVADAVVVNYFDTPPVAYMFATAAGLLEQSDRIRAICKIPHVVAVRLVVNDEYGVAVDRLVGWCNDAIDIWNRRV